MSNNLLRNALRANAAFSTVASAALLIGGAALAEWLGLQTGVVYLVGLGLLPFALLAWTTSNTLDHRSAVSIIAGDAVWVVLATVVILGFGDAMSTAGLWALGAVSLAVADFAIAQTIGLRRVTT